MSLCNHTLLRRTLLLALIVIVLDQVSKWAILDVLHITEDAPIIVLPVFRLVLVWNFGISFGMLAHPGTHVPWFLQIVAVAISGVLAWLAYKSTSRGEQLAYGMIIGGALGNVIDRLRFGAVVDFLSFHYGSWAYPAFNVADASIFLGVFALVVMSLKNARKARGGE